MPKAKEKETVRKKRKKQALLKLEDKMEKMRYKDIIRQNNLIRQMLLKRFKEKALTIQYIIADALKLEFPISRSSLSKYLNHGHIPNSISQESVLWLCLRWGIEVNLSVKLLPYNEDECLLNLLAYSGKYGNNIFIKPPETNGTSATMDRSGSEKFPGPDLSESQKRISSAKISTEYKDSIYDPDNF